MGGALRSSPRLGPAPRHFLPPALGCLVLQVEPYRLPTCQLPERGWWSSSLVGVLLNKSIGEASMLLLLLGVVFFLLLNTSQNEKEFQYLSLSDSGLCY